jgi:polysaccharide pyruvyl transferase WcaK-like protein
VTDYTSDTADKQAFVAKLCERLVDSFNTNIVLVSHSPRDLFVLWMIRDCIRNEFKSRVLVPDTREWQDKTIKKMISRCRCAIGGRYHFIVFAGTSDTPFVGMAGNHYSYIKQDGFARVLGQERYILTEKETWDEEVLWQRISERVDQRLNLSEKFERPSVSMNRFGKWLQDRFDLPVKDAT